MKTKTEVIFLADECVKNEVCLERCKRLEEEDKRQNERLKQLEISIGEINPLAQNTEKLAVSIEQMVVEQRNQGVRISKLEGRDGEKWRDVVKIVATAVIGALIGAVLMMIGIK